MRGWSEPRRTASQPGLKYSAPKKNTYVDYLKSFSTLIIFSHRLVDILSEILISPISFYSLKCQKSNHSVVSGSLQPHGLYSPWNSPGQNTGVDSLSLLQGIFPTQGLNPDLPQFRWILYQLSHQGSPRILEWVAYPFSSGSSQPRNQTGISCIAGGFFTN